VTERRRHSTQTEWEERIGYSRALRVGNHIQVSGTLGVGPDGGPAGDAYAQAVASLDRIQGALEALGGSISDVVRTRMFVVDAERHQADVGRAHAERFSEVRPASSMIGVTAFAAPGFVVEIEVDAIVDA
jgi:enamine deaminase RidA (YjgF/YER057c/UK114 family)